MSKFSKKLGVLTLGISLIAGVGVALLIPKSIPSIQTNATTPASGTTYTLVNSTDDLVVGADYTFVAYYNSIYCAASTDMNVYSRKVTVITVSDNSFSSNEKVLNLELGGKSGAWTFKTTNYDKIIGQGYLASGSNSLTKSYLGVERGYGPDDPDLPTCTINFEGDFANIIIKPNNTLNKIKFDHLLNDNLNGGGFSCYSSEEQTNIYLYKAETSAKYWADDFLATTKDACADPSKDNQEAVEAVWNSTLTKYNLLSDADKKILKEATHTTENVGEALERYDVIIKRYASTSTIISNYLDRTITSNNQSIMGFDRTATITIVSIVTLSSVAAVAVFLLTKKFKHK